MTPNFPKMPPQPPLTPQTVAHVGRSALFWTPDFQGSAPALCHVPALFWLAEIARPSTVLGLGLRRADGYFALCQAIATLGLSARAWGFGAWDLTQAAATDPLGQSAQTGVMRLPEALRVHHAQHYADLSRLAVVADPLQALARFDTCMFDILLVDGDGAGDDLAGLAGGLVSRASRRGIVVILGTAQPGPAQGLLDLLAADHPVLMLGGGAGSALVLVGPDRDPRLMALAAQPDSAQGLRALLDRLGQGLVDGWQARRAQTQIADLVLVRDAAQKAAASAAQAGADRMAALQTHLDQLHHQRLQETRLLTTELERLTEALRAQAEEGARAQAAAVLATEAAAQNRIEAMQQELAALQIRQFEETSDLQTDIDRLTRALGAAQTAATAAQGAAASARADFHKAQTALQQTEAAAQRMEKTRSEQLDALTRAHAADLVQQQQAHAEALALHATQSHRALEQSIATLTQAHLAELARTKAQALQVAQAHADLIADLQGTLTIRDHALSAQKQKITRLEVQVKLRQWQVLWMASARGRLGKRHGPSGGMFATELAQLARHPLFDAQWYLSAYPDLQDSAMAPAEHFLRHGLFEGRNPGPRLHLLDWFVTHPDAVEARRNPLLDPNPMS